jgi:hypothetical protein
VGVRRFKLVNITAVGYHLPVKARVDNFTYRLLAAAYVSADASAVRPLPAQNGTDLCSWASNSTPHLPTAVVQYLTPYAVRLGPPAQGPRGASGLAAFYVSTEKPADQPLHFSSAPFLLLVNRPSMWVCIFVD